MHGKDRSLTTWDLIPSGSVRLDGTKSFKKNLEIFKSSLKGS
jgi:hypothetical protein